jgi:hypothetical protein
MGVSTDAKFVYGFEVEEGSADHEQCDRLMVEKYSTLSRVEKGLGGCLVYHGSDTHTCYIVGVEETHVVAWRGHPKVINVWGMAKLSPRDLDDTLRHVAEGLGVTPKPGKWLLC